jgi:hypothetical protein
MVHLTASSAQQLAERTSRFCFAVTAAGLPFGFAWAGNVPLVDRVLHRCKTPADNVGQDSLRRGEEEQQKPGREGEQQVDVIAAGTGT